MVGAVGDVRYRIRTRIRIRYPRGQALTLPSTIRHQYCLVFTQHHFLRKQPADVSQVLLLSTVTNGNRLVKSVDENKVESSIMKQRFSSLDVKVMVDDLFGFAIRIDTFMVAPFPRLVNLIFPGHFPRIIECLDQSTSSEHL